MREDAQRRMAEADRLLNEPLLVQALEDLQRNYLEELLRGPPATIPLTDHDLWRRQRIDTITTVRAVPDAIRAAMLVAKDQIRPRSGVA